MLSLTFISLKPVFIKEWIYCIFPSAGVIITLSRSPKSPSSLLRNKNLLIFLFGGGGLRGTVAFSKRGLKSSYHTSINKTPGLIQEGFLFSLFFLSNFLASFRGFLFCPFFFAPLRGLIQRTFLFREGFLLMDVW